MDFVESVFANQYLRARFWGASNVRFEEERAPKDELRGVWVTTVRNNDFPSPAVYENDFDVVKFKQEFESIIAKCLEFRINALFFQVRPEGDAFYPSGVNPWSMYLTGEQGVKPNWGDFDPLTWVIARTHAAGMEFHAWFNPYRLTPSNRKGKSKEELVERLSVDHYARRHPDWVYFFNGELFLDPGVPAVTEFMVSTVHEVLVNYDVDAVHLDDFFYPYPYEIIQDGKVEWIYFKDVNPDYESYIKYRSDVSQELDEWREGNINHLVYTLHEEVERYNKETSDNVEFGISPFGVWESSDESGGVGSNTSSAQLSSLDVYVNSKLWIDEGWIDYIVPQVYWAMEDELSPFAVLCDWWNEVVSGTKTKLYIGLGLYLYDEDASNSNWQDAGEIVRQVRYVRGLENVSGFVFFTYHNLVPERAMTSVMRDAIEKIKGLM